MKINGSVALHYPAATIWHSLTNPRVMQQSIPGCERFQRLSEREYQADICFKITFLSISFSVNLTIVEAEQDARYVFDAVGDGGKAGSASGRCAIALENTADGSTLNYDATVQIAGMLQKVAEPLIAKKAHTLIEKYFVRFEQAIAAEQAES